MNRVLSFSQFHRLNENENPGETALNTVISILTQTYGKIVTLIKDYDGIDKDLRDLNNAVSDDPKVLGKYISDKIKGLAGKIPKEYKDQTSQLLEIASELENCYNAVLEEYPDLNPKKIVRDSIENYYEELKKAAKAAKDAENKGGESGSGSNVEESYFDGDLTNFLFEKNLFNDSREALRKSLIALETDLNASINNPVLDRYKSKFGDILKKVSSDMESIEDKNFSPMKRRERINRLEEIGNKIQGYGEEINKIKAEFIKKSGVESKISDMITKLTNSLNSFVEGIQKIQQEILAKEEEDKKAKEEKEKKDKEDEENKEGGGDLKDYTEMKSGGDNLKKNNKNLDQIKKIQTEMNSLLPDKKIGEDGLYGTNTEKAVLTVAKLLDKLGDSDTIEKSVKGGKVMSPEFQKSLLFDLPKIKEEFRGKESK